MKFLFLSSFYPPLCTFGSFEFAVHLRFRETSKNVQQYTPPSCTKMSVLRDLYSSVLPALKASAELVLQYKYREIFALFKRYFYSTEWS